MRPDKVRIINQSLSNFYNEIKYTKIFTYTKFNKYIKKILFLFIFDYKQFKSKINTIYII